MKLQGKTKSMGAGLVLGVTLSLLVLLLGLAVLAKLMEQDKIAYSSMGYGILLSIIMASLAGSTMSICKIRRRKLLVAAAHAFLLWGVLLCLTALFFGGAYSGAGVTAIAIFCGSMLPILLLRTDGAASRSRRKRHKL